jgi:hypothetical protein
MSQCTFRIIIIVKNKKWLEWHRKERGKGIFNFEAFTSRACSVCTEPQWGKSSDFINP